jgi:hypothetical protein
VNNPIRNGERNDHMSEQLPETVEHDEQEHTHPSTLLRFLPAVTFGLQTAALAGMFVTAGAAALGLGGTFDDTLNVAFTTCCTEESATD